jgi:hypothetical protein
MIEPECKLEGKKSMESLNDSISILSKELGLAEQKTRLIMERLNIKCIQKSLPETEECELNAILVCSREIGEIRLRVENLKIALEALAFDI